MKLALLFAPCVLALARFQFGATCPFRVPFFYWFQLLLVPVSALTIYVADRQRRG